MREWMSDGRGQCLNKFRLSLVSIVLQSQISTLDFPSSHTEFSMWLEDSIRICTVTGSLKSAAVINIIDNVSLSYLW